jgi:hypothetical protein
MLIELWRENDKTFVMVLMSFYRRCLAPPLCLSILLSKFYRIVPSAAGLWASRNESLLIPSLLLLPIYHYHIPIVWLCQTAFVDNFFLGLPPNLPLRREDFAFFAVLILPSACACMFIIGLSYHLVFYLSTC